MKNQMKKSASRGHFRSLQAQFATALALLNVSVMQAYADLPDLAEPSQGAADGGDFIGWLRGYMYDILVFGGLLVAAIALFVVAKNVMSAYGEVQDGKGSWGNFAVNIVVGVVLLVFIVFLMTEAADVLST